MHTCLHQHVSSYLFNLYINGNSAVCLFICLSVKLFPTINISSSLAFLLASLLCLTTLNAILYPQIWNIYKIKLRGNYSLLRSGRFIKSEWGRFKKHIQSFIFTAQSWTICKSTLRDLYLMLKCSNISLIEYICYIWKIYESTLTDFYSRERFTP